MVDVLEIFGGWYDLPANISYVLFAISLFLTNIFWLRVLLVVSLAFEIVYFAMTSSHLYTGMAWDVIFIGINLYRLFNLLAARRVLRQVSGGHLLRSRIGARDDEPLAELVRLGEAFDLEPGALLTVENKPVDYFYLITAGHTVVLVNDTEVGHIGPGQFVGEVSFLTGIDATATVQAAGIVSVIALDRRRLSAACHEDPRISAAVHEVVGKALARKLVMANRERVAEARGG